MSMLVYFAISVKFGIVPAEEGKEKIISKYEREGERE